MSRIIQFAIALAVICSSTCSAIASHRAHVQKLKVRFLATSTVVHPGWGLSQDIYLAEMMSSSVGTDPQLVRLVDEYNQAGAPLTRETLISGAGAALKVRRDSQCDLAYGAIVLRTAPGDPRAILPERLGYQPAMRRTPEPNEIVPCYRTVR